MEGQRAKVELWVKPNSGTQKLGSMNSWSLRSQQVASGWHLGIYIRVHDLRKSIEKCTQSEQSATAIKKSRNMHGGERDGEKSEEG